ncbi:MAG: sensor histidine kinase [Lachnospiraceae bacterium]|nr:sensor histidine kinase [Lachnospiraceae bacterium]
MSGQKGGQEDGPKDRQEGRLKDGSKGGSKDGQRDSPKDGPEDGQRDRPKDGPKSEQRDRLKDGSEDGQRDRLKDGPEDGQRDRLKSGQRAGQKDRLLLLGWAASISLIAVAVSLLLVSNHYSRYQFDLLSGVCRGVVEREPEARAVVAAALKEAMGGGPGSGPSGGPGGGAGEDVLSALGYRREDLAGPVHGTVLLSAMIGLVAGILLFICTFSYRDKKAAVRIQALTEYLEQVETGKAAILSATGEDGFSKLEDGIYKTVTSLYQTRDAAVQARNALAENLANIAHQIKTPITAISLSVQRMEQDAADLAPLAQVRKQLSRLTHLEEALLVLSRIDAGTLLLQKEEVDVYTLLVLAADTLQGSFAGSGTAIDIPELGKMRIIADLDWTMEAVMNLMKDCMEHDPGGRVHCSYAQELLYTEILIWDEGKGFAKEDLPHLFERFYRGKDAGEGGIGIGLALSKELIERQNGTIWAQNRPGGGALFAIRFYSH